MAINLITSTPQQLLTDFKSKIDKKNIVTWSYDPNGDFTHTPDQWRFQAWLRPTVYNGRLVMNFIGNNRKNTTKADYGVYHGRFIESMLTHCDDLFVHAEATAQPTNSDILTSGLAA